MDMIFVEIPANKCGSDLRKLIKEENPNSLASVDERQLYPHAARVDDGSWISARDPDVSALRNRVCVIRGRVAAMLYNDNTRIRSHHLIADVFSDVRRSDLVVHVLVELLPMVSATDEDPQREIGIDTVRMRHLEPHRNAAQRLKAVRDVENRIAKIVEQQHQELEPVSFIVLENSSGTGKTQMAFNLEASERYEVFYVLASPIDDGEQRVYTAFFSRTVAFFACAGKDMVVLREGSVREFKQREQMYLYGLIAAVLSGNDTIGGPASRADVEQLLHQRRLEKAKHCVFFLDEFPRVHRMFVKPNHELRILTMLNVF